jgi:hypothetical protein
MDLDADELREEIYSIFHPEPIIGIEGEEWHERLPDERLRACSSSKAPINIAG